MQQYKLTTRILSLILAGGLLVPSPAVALRPVSAGQEESPVRKELQQKLIPPALLGSQGRSIDVSELEGNLEQLTRYYGLLLKDKVIAWSRLRRSIRIGSVEQAKDVVNIGGSFIHRFHLIEYKVLSAEKSGVRTEAINHRKPGSTAQSVLIPWKSQLNLVYVPPQDKKVVIEV